MVSRAIWKELALVSFSVTPNCTSPQDCNFGVIDELTRACYFQIAHETTLLPILIE